MTMPAIHTPMLNVKELPPVRARPTRSARASIDGICDEQSERPASANETRRPDTPSDTPPHTPYAMSRPIGRTSDPGQRPTVAMLTKLAKPSGSCLDDYEMIAILGHGSSARVWGAKHILSGTPVAIKVIAKVNETVTPTRVFQESDIMEALGQHTYVVTLHAAFQTHESLCFVMRYAANGDLYGVLRKAYEGVIPEIPPRRGLGEECTKV